MARHTMMRPKQGASHMGHVRSQKPAKGFASTKGRAHIPGLGSDNGLHHAIKTSDGGGTKGKYSTIESKP